MSLASKLRDEKYSGICDLCGEEMEELYYISWCKEGRPVARLLCRYCLRKCARTWKEVESLSVAKLGKIEWKNRGEHEEK